MQRIYDPTAAAVLPTPPALTGNIGFFQGGTGATRVRYWWLNMVQEELMSLLAAGGITPDTTGTNVTQVLQALRVLFRVKLTGALNLYVSTTGSDANNGLTAGTPFLTLQKAWNTIIENYDLDGQTVTVNVANGTYTAGVACVGNPIGATSGINNVPGGAGPSVIFAGNPTTPSNCVIIATNNNCFMATNGAQIAVNGFKLEASGTTTNYNGEGLGLYAFFGGGIQFSNINFGACSGAHILSTVASLIQSTGNPYTISGGAPIHVQCYDGGYATCAGSAVTLIGTPAFSSSFVNAGACGVMYMPGMTFGGSGATGPVYVVTLNGVINTNGGGASYFPGNAAGSASAGGVYN
ncbi:MAG TPA: hypothetical protein VK741_25620 [Acetobacteraceae bacterium]|jgi:hypothetical protein|nr:hypothetical protein [Acetobacteraceae bacterium]